MSPEYGPLKRVAADVRQGNGVVLRDFINLYGCSIGDDSHVGAFVEIQKKARIGRRCKISSHTFICEGVTIEDDCFIRHHVCFINDRLPRAVTAAGILSAGARDDAVGRTINVGSGAELTVRALADMVRRVVGRPDAEILHDEPRPGYVLRLCADTTRATRLLGWRPRVGLADGLARLLQWYRGRPRGPEELLEEERVHNWEPAPAAASARLMAADGLAPALGAQ